MESEQVTLDRWLVVVQTHNDESLQLLNKLLTSLDEIDKSLVAIAMEISDLK